MIGKFFFILSVAAATSSAGVVPVAPAPLLAPAFAPAAYAIAPYASSYSAHTVNHAVAAPVFAPAPVVAPAPLIAPAPLAPAPLVAPAAPYFAAPSPFARYLSAPVYFK